MMKSCIIHRLTDPGRITNDWSHPAWSDLPILDIDQPQGDPSGHRPVTRARLACSAEGLHGIFRVEDRYVLAAADRINGPVWEDSCVECFFTPWPAPASAYFNLEINCCGVPLLRYQDGPQSNIRFLDPQDLQRLTIVSSLTGPIIEEITEPVTWTLAFTVPWAILQRYAAFPAPRSGDRWRGNLYKCADASSHPHWLTWSPIVTERPDFHRPDQFGDWIFR